MHTSKSCHFLLAIWVVGAALGACQKSSKPVDNSASTQQGPTDAAAGHDAAQLKQPGAPMGRIDWSRIDKIVYRFGDSSVPPPHHRSFDITLTAQSFSKVVDSYGDIIETNVKPATPEMFAQATAACRDANVQFAADTTPQVGCPGGTTDTLTLYAGQTVVATGTSGRCGNDRSGTLSGDIDTLTRLLNELFNTKSAK